MEIAASEVTVPGSTSTWTIHHLTDLHADDSDHAAPELAAKIREIEEDPQALWIGGGDYGSLILPGDPRFSTSRSQLVHRLPDVYLERMEETFAPIASKCIGFATGNHEATIGKYYHRGVGAELAMRLGFPDRYLGVRGWVILTFRLNPRRCMTLKFFQYHGWSAGRLKGRKAIQAERDLGAWSADAFFLGHDHQPAHDTWYTEEAYSDSRNGAWRLRQVPRAYINGGSWTYGQRPPLEGKNQLKASEFPNEAWVEGRNFRPQPPVSPVLLCHVDFGTTARPQSYSLETRMNAPVFNVGRAS